MAYRVVPRATSWSVSRTGARKAFGNYQNATLAYVTARRLAKKYKTLLYIYDKKGRIDRREDYR